MKKTVMSITLALVLVVIGSLLLGKVIKSGIEENDSGSGSVSGGSVDDINGVVDNDDVHPGDEYDYSSLLALDIDGAVELMREIKGLEFGLTQKVEDSDFEGHDRLHLWGGKRYLGKDYKAVEDESGNKSSPDVYVEYIVTGYPDTLSEDHCVTWIDITDPKITVFGLNVESEMDEVIKTLEEKGFSTEEKLQTVYRACKDGIHIAFSKGRISINADVTNVHGVVY